MDKAVMDTTLIGELERYRFSLARRIFVVGEMQARAMELGLDEFVERLGKLLAADREGLHREVKRRSTLWVQESKSGRERGGRDEGHLPWLMLIMEIQRQGEGGEGHWILEPVYQQLRRLKDYSQRGRRKELSGLSGLDVVMGNESKVLWADGAE